MIYRTAPFQWPWTTPTPGFNVTPFLTLNILETVIYRHSFNIILIGTYIRATQQCRFEWPWLILNNLAKYSMTRSVARSLCDSWACTYRKHVSEIDRVSALVSLSKAVIISSHFFPPSGSQTILVFPYQTSCMAIFRLGPPNRWVKCRWDRHKSRLSANVSGCRLMTAGAIVLSTDGRPSSSVSQLRCTSVHGTESHASVNTPKRREHNLIYAAVNLLDFTLLCLKTKETNNRRLRSTNSTIEANYWQTRGLSATAGLLFEIMAAKEKHCRPKKTIFSVPLVGPLGRWPPKRSVRDTAWSVCKMSAKSVQQFRRRCFPNKQTDKQQTKCSSLPWGDKNWWAHCKIR